MAANRSSPKGSGKTAPASKGAKKGPEASSKQSAAQTDDTTAPKPAAARAVEDEGSLAKTLESPPTAEIVQARKKMRAKDKDQGDSADKKAPAAKRSPRKADAKPSKPRNTRSRAVRLSEPPVPKRPRPRARVASVAPPPNSTKARTAGSAEAPKSKDPDSSKVKQASLETEPETPPPGIPSPPSKSTKTDKNTQKRKRKRPSKKGRRLSTLKIPDDDVPATPTPPAVAAVGPSSSSPGVDLNSAPASDSSVTSSPTPDSYEPGVDSSPPISSKPVPSAPRPSAPTSSPPQALSSPQPSTPAPGEDDPDTLPAKSKPEKTVSEKEPSTRRISEEVTDPESPRSEPSSKRKSEPVPKRTSSATANRPSSKQGASAADGDDDRDDLAITAEIEKADTSEIDGSDTTQTEESDVAAPEEARQAGPGILTDERAVTVILPVQISSDLPPVQPESPASESPESNGSQPLPMPERVPTGRPPPPPRNLESDQLEDIEEIEPDRMSLPGPPPDEQEGALSIETPTPDDGLPGSARRPLPPPRSAQIPAIDGQEPAPTEPTPPGEASAPGAVEAPAPEGPPPTGPEPTAAGPTPETPDAAVQRAGSPPQPPQRQAESPPAKQQPKAWWVEMFDQDFIRTLDRPSADFVSREVDFIERSLRLEKGAGILDLGSGMGQHAVAMAARGYNVVAVDLSPDMLALAAEHAKQQGQLVNFVKGDMRKLDLDSVFDGIYCWSASFGYFDDKTNTSVLERVHRALRRGGMFALDVTNRDFVAPRSPTMVWFEHPGCVCMDEMRFDFFSSRLIVKRMVMFDNGRSRELEYSIRLYGLHELGRLLHHVGFKVVEVSGDRAYRGAYFGSESPRTIIVAERL